MSFDTKHYNEIKELTDKQLNFVDFRLADKYRNKPFDWAKTFLPLVSNCVQSEDYEAAKAMSDSIREFLNNFLPDSEQIPGDAEMKLPEFKQVKIKGIICFCR